MPSEEACCPWCGGALCITWSAKVGSPGRDLRGEPAVGEGGNEPADLVSETTGEQDIVGPSSTPGFDRKTYQREYMRAYMKARRQGRAERRGAKQKVQIKPSA